MLELDEEGCEFKPCNGCSCQISDCISNDHLPQVILNSQQCLTEGFGDYQLVVHIMPLSLRSRMDPPARFLEMWETFQASGESLTATPSQVLQQLNKCVDCVGCRRSVSAALKSFAGTRHETFQPFFVLADGSVTLHDSIFKNPMEAFSYLYPFRNIRNLSSSAGKRCMLHRANPASLLEKQDEDAWTIMWNTIPAKMREYIMDFDEEEVEEVALAHMRKFCTHCRHEVEKALDVLKDMEWFNDGESATYLKNTGYDPVIFEGLCYECDTQVLQVSCDTTYLSEVIAFARKDGQDRERHAESNIKAQTEVVMVVGHLVHNRIKTLQARLAALEQQMSLAYAVIANTLWHCLESDAAERAAAAAAKDLIDEEETTARKKKKKNKKKKEAADARSMSSARACTKSKPVHVHAIETVDDSLACSPQSDDMPSDMDENEYRLLRSMGWQRAESNAELTVEPDVNFDTIKAKQLLYRQQIRKQFDQFCTEGNSLDIATLTV